MKLTSPTLQDLVETEGLSDNVLSEAGPRLHRQVTSAVNDAVDIVSRRINLLTKDIARMKGSVRELERAGYSWNDFEYRSLLADIGDLERALSSVTGSLRLVQRSASVLAKGDKR